MPHPPMLTILGLSTVADAFGGQQAWSPRPKGDGKVPGSRCLCPADVTWGLLFVVP